MNEISKDSFGLLQDETEINIFTLSNSNGIELKVINLGGVIVSLKVPDKNGIIDDIVLGFETLQGYLHNIPYFGAIVGRYANRIAKGMLTIGDKHLSLAQNNSGNHLHGGINGFHAVYWKMEEKVSTEGTAICLVYISQDMEEGYPGNLKVAVTYTLTEENELKIDYTATTDKETIINLTQHSYFNLCGAKSHKNILSHEIILNADRFVPVDETLIPTGTLQEVEGTPFDLRKPVIIGKNISLDDPQLAIAGGFDHCWVLNGPDHEMKFAAAVFEPESGRTLEVYTTEPGMQFYSGNFLDGSMKGKDGIDYQKNDGFCLETSHFPDSPNQPSFPSVLLHPGKLYKSTTIFKFNGSEHF